MKTAEHQEKRDRNERPHDSGMSVSRCESSSEIRLDFVI